MTPADLIEAAHKYWPAKDGYYVTVQYDSCQFWSTVSLRVADCNNDTQPKAILHLTGNTLEKLLEEMERIRVVEAVNYVVKCGSKASEDSITFWVRSVGPKTILQSTPEEILECTSAF